MSADYHHIMADESIKQETAMGLPRAEKRQAARTGKYAMRIAFAEYLSGLAVPETQGVAWSCCGETFTDVKQCQRHVSTAHKDDVSNLAKRRKVSTMTTTMTDTACCQEKGESETAQHNHPNDSEEVLPSDNAASSGGLGTSKNNTHTDKNSKPVGSDAHPRSQLHETRCHYYLPRKRRYCRSAFYQDTKYCVEHLHLVANEDEKTVDKKGINAPLDSSQDSTEKVDESLGRYLKRTVYEETITRKRVPCPLDPTHTCYEHRLKGHLKKCNSRGGQNPVYYTKDINNGEELEEPSSKTTPKTLSSADIGDVMSLIEKVKDIFREHVGCIREDILSHEALHEELGKTTNGLPALKHHKQNASLVGHVENMGFLSDKTCYLEFGAGRGGLSHWVQRAMFCNKTDVTDTQFILIEKGSNRYKMDSYHKGEDQGPSFERLRVNIQHLDLDKVPSLQTSTKPMIGIGKHLCGGATDLMLRCLMESIKTSTNKCSGIVLALCCHHYCDWRSYVGKTWLSQFGITPYEFRLLVGMTSWATCATRAFLNKLNEKKEKVDDTSFEEEDHKIEDSYDHPRYGSLSPEQREEIGYQCKRLLDMGRVHYIRNYGYSAELVKYTTLETTLENVVLLVKKIDTNS